MKAIAVAVSIGLSMVGCARAIADSRPLNEHSERVEVSSDLLAAFIVAYEDERQEAQKEGGEFTPADFANRFGRVSLVRKTNDQVVVLMPPRSIHMRGGVVEYVIEFRTLEIMARNLIH